MTNVYYVQLAGVEFEAFYVLADTIAAVALRYPDATQIAKIGLGTSIDLGGSLVC